MRVQIRVKPGASRTRVGGRYGDDTLVVAVQQPAVDGRATAAALAAVAKAVGVPTRAVVLIRGATHRTKLIELPDSAAGAVAALLHQA
ncbi:MAG: DUF167 domain-containing protein [Micropruina sp.]|nr:DUF167 domain-containing protein [Micropruina sp.]